MPDVTSGLTFAADENGRAPDTGLDADTALAAAQIREQSERARQTPSDDATFNREAIHGALLGVDPTSIAAGLEDVAETQAAERDAARHAELAERYGPDSEAGRALAEEQEMAAFGRSQLRLQEVVLPAFAVLQEDYDAEARAEAIVQLTPSERVSAIEAGLTDEEELAELVALAAQILDQKMQVGQQIVTVMAAEQESQDRAVAFQSLIAEFGLSDQDANVLLATAIARTQEAGISLGALPVQAWETAVRQVYGEIVAEGKGEAVRQMKQQIVDAQLSDLQSGLTEGGRPVVDRLIIQPRIDYSIATKFAAKREAGMTDAEFRTAVANAGNETAIESGLSDGADAVPAATRQKMAALFGS